MARQVRSEVTRRRLLDAAVDVFGEVGYGAAGRVAIVDRAGVTKGALYHHFDSMESLASAVIEEGAATVLNAFRAMCPPSSPALEGMISGLFAAAEVLARDKAARVAMQLVPALADFSDTAAGVNRDWLRAVGDLAARAIAEGDVRADVDPDGVGDLVVGAVFGSRLLSQDDAAGRLARMWGLVLPAVAVEPGLPYFREFLAREAVRHRPRA